MKNIHIALLIFMFTYLLHGFSDGRLFSRDMLPTFQKLDRVTPLSTNSQIVTDDANNATCPSDRPVACGGGCCLENTYCCGPVCCPNEYPTCNSDKYDPKNAGLVL
ncbi:hypothetical protein C2G38_2052998 [Gigaspora rosea]|uniref:Granulins domain-containing protein n=1 Tax=Gigaspora rosea TaxID=44941 RepID=A0A397W8P8_9GLOM|nr:hypothetical protein C2G38_2052998 [Gigaspora rosea]